MLSSLQLGERIAAARKERGFTQAALARQIGLARTTLVAVEKGERRPSDDELLRMAESLDVPLHELLRHHWVKGEIAPRFRLPRLAGVEPESLRRAVDALRRLGRRRAVLEHLLGNARPPASPLEAIDAYRVSDAGSALPPALAGTSAAQRVRDLLSLGQGPALSLDELLETEAGLRIFYLEELPPEIAGLMVWGPEIGGCIAIQPRLPHEHRRWALAREVGHFLLDPEAGNVSPARKQKRVTASGTFAEAFARAFLLPYPAIARHFSDRYRSNGASFTVSDLLWMADFFEAPFRAVALDLEELGFIPRGSYERIALKRSGSEQGAEGFPSSRTASAAGPSPPRFSARYVSLALDAYERGLATEGELAEYLETDRLTARELYQNERQRDLGEGFEVELDLSENLLLAS